MATVTLTWEIEGIHDGIGVYRSNNLNTGYELIATLAPNTLIFEDEFLLSQLTAKHGTEPETLFYRLDAFRGLDVKQSDPIPVPLEDTMPDFLDGIDLYDKVDAMGITGADYYSLGSHTIGTSKYHVLAGVRNSESFFITDPATDIPFTEVNQYLRGLPTGAATLQDSIAFTTLFKQQHVVGNPDMKTPVYVPFLNRNTPVLEVLPSITLMNQLNTQVLGLANKLSVTGYLWSSTLNASNTNEFGQVTDINVTRYVIGGSTDAKSILGNDKAKVMTFLLIDDITP